MLKDKLNEMIRNLRETTRQNTEQDWLKTNLERFTRMLQGQRDLATVSSMILSELAPLVSAQHGVFYTLITTRAASRVLRYQAGYGFKERKHLASEFRLGEGLVGQCAQEKERILLTDVPGDYIRINSGPRRVHAAEHHRAADPVRGLGAGRRRAGLVQPLQPHPPGVPRPAHGEHRARAQHDRGQHAHREPAQAVTVPGSGAAVAPGGSAQPPTRISPGRPARLAEQNIEVEAKNQEVQYAKRLVEEKAEQLAVSSAYKSEFFANMSHELRTPLNSLLILAGELKANPEKNLTDEQVHYASIIQSSGTDLLRLLNDVLDLAKMESGTATLEISELPLVELHDALEREFRHVADQQGVSFAVELAPGTPSIIATDPGRLRQVLKNLLANAFKFTEHGAVTLRIGRPGSGLAPGERDVPATRVDVTAFSVSDTGVGIAPELQEVIFEAFAQADGSTARQYGGTGLGLSISRELVGLLGGEMTLESTFGEGSTFTVYLPVGAAAPIAPTIAAAAARRAARHAVAESRSSPFDLRQRSRQPDSVGGGRADGQEGAGRRRRLPQHLRHHRAPRARRHRGRLGRERRGGARACSSDSPTSTSC